MSSTVNNKLIKHTKEEDDQAYTRAMLLANLQMFPGILKAAIELNLFDIISQLAPTGDHLSVSEIASLLPSQHPELPDRLDRMLRALSCFSLLDCSVRSSKERETERFYKLSLTGKYFLQNETESLAAFAMFNCHPAIVKVGLNAKDAILDGGMDIFNKVHGIPVWTYMQTDTKMSQTFNKAMVGNSAIQMRKYLEVYNGFEGISTLVDVGGGIGQSLKMIISKYPNIKGINFDLPYVIQHAPSYPGIEHVGGDMYESVPKGDAIMMKSLCHDWPDDKCIAVLKNCYKSLPQNGKVIILDMIMPQEPDSSDGIKLVSITDITMIIHISGKERTLQEFEKLCKESGFSSFKVTCQTLSVHGVVELYK